jgi:hypothetical protein
VFLACATSAGPEDVASSEDELRTVGVSHFVVSAHAGFVPPTPIGACVFSSGTYDVDFVGKFIRGSACVEGGKVVSADRAITDDEVLEMRKALRSVRVVPTPTSCPTDGPGLSLKVQRGPAETTYTVPHNACFLPGSIAAESIGKVLAAAVKLSSPTSQTVEGELVTHFAIGGESTGLAVRTENGLVEFALPPGGTRDAFVPGRKAILVGALKQQTGVEIGSREVLFVDRHLVCPAAGAAVNCQPPTDSAMCAFENRSWLQRNCDGISFLH